MSPGNGAAPGRVPGAGQRSDGTSIRTQDSRPPRQDEQRQRRLAARSHARAARRHLDDIDGLDGPELAEAIGLAHLEIARAVSVALRWQL